MLLRRCNLAATNVGLRELNSFDLVAEYTWHVVCTAITQSRP